MRTRSPRWPWVLGLAGLIPFAGLVAAAWGAPPPYDGVSAGAWTAYAAVILSFLGGTRWGLEIVSRPEGPSPLVLTMSNLPSLLGWMAVVLNLLAPAVSVGLLVGGFVLQWAWDAASTGQGPRRFPPWYGPLRTVLTGGVLASAAGMVWVRAVTG